MHDLLSLVKISTKVCGLKQVLLSIIEDTARCVIVSNDSDDFIVDKVKSACADKNIEFHHAHKARELGKACGIQVGAATVAILK